MTAAMAATSGLFAKKVKFQVDMTGKQSVHEFTLQEIFKKQQVLQIIGNQVRLL